MKPERTPYDGKPYYCDTCGAGFNDVIRCSEAGCEMESTADAKARAEAAKLSNKGRQ